jgi:ribosomal protein S18 acetylase RimI-like enzyme
MTHNPIVLRVGEVAEIEAFLAERIYEFNANATGYRDGESFSATQQDESGAIQAGISGYTWGGCCYITNLWVHNSKRGQGLGSTLLQAAEAHAKTKGCVVMLLSSHSFQAPGFYEHMGFEQQAVVVDHPPGHTNILFAKRLQTR